MTHDFLKHSEGSIPPESLVDRYNRRLNYLPEAEAEEIELSYLADILVGIYLSTRRDEQKNLCQEVH